MRIDRFEGEFAVIVTSEGTMNIRRDMLPAAAQEGDVIRYENGLCTLDNVKTNELREGVEEKIRRLLRGEYD